jgi:hypothetical protein
MPRWNLDDLPWDAFRRDLVEPRLLAVVKAAALVEHNSASYGEHLASVFAGDEVLIADARRWSLEEVQHGRALARWVALADPGYDHAEALRSFAARIQVGTPDGSSRRGSRRGELIARATVEVGTSSFYSALAEAASEPLLKTIASRIAADEFAHYRLFTHHEQRLAASEPIGPWKRLRIALGRVSESGDDELAYALCCALGHTARYRRKSYAAAHAAWSMAAYRRDDIRRAVRMILRSVGWSSQGMVAQALMQASWWIFRLRRAFAACNARDLARALPRL